MRAPPQDNRSESCGNPDGSVNGEPRPARELLPLVYDELRRLAAQRLAREVPGQTLQATALVHEVYLRLVGSDPNRPWDGRGHFFAAAAEAMRRILVENARRRHRVKRGGNRAGSTSIKPSQPHPRPTTTCWRSMRPWHGSPRKTRSKPSSFNFASLPG